METFNIFSPLVMLLLGLGDMAKNIITITFFISVDIDYYHETRRLIMCGIMGCVVQYVELVGYLGCDVKTTGLQLHLVFLRDISHHIFWEI